MAAGVIGVGWARLPASSVIVGRRGKQETETRNAKPAADQAPTTPSVPPTAKIAPGGSKPDEFFLSYRRRLHAITAPKGKEERGEMPTEARLFRVVDRDISTSCEAVAKSIELFVF